MRIRKNAKISPLLSTLEPGTILQAHNCQLNQSPWDVVMDFSPSSSPFLQAAGGDDGWWGNGSSRDSISAVERVSPSWSYDRISHLLPEVKWEELGEASRYSGKGKKVEKPMLCCKMDEKSWKWGRDAVRGGSMTEHNLTVLRNNASHPKKPKLESVAKEIQESHRRRRRPRMKKASSSSSSDPYAMHYYTNFGHKWGKKRGERGRREEPKDMPRNTGVDQEHVIAKEEEHENEEKEKKRARKRIKARSLKSLM